jgi:hypothetical protein
VTDARIRVGVDSGQVGAGLTGSFESPIIKILAEVS